MKNKIQIHHFVNLIGWEEVLDIMKSSKNYDFLQNFYCDTISLKFLSTFFDKGILKFRGPNALRILIEQKKEIEYLISKSANIHQIALPQFDDNKSYQKFATSFCPKKNNIAIGISTPKQNHLALCIAKNSQISFNLEIWCFGAAIYNQNNLILGHFRLFGFFFSDPIRVLKKLSITIKEIILIVIFKRKKFKEFCNYLVKH